MTVLQEQLQPAPGTTFLYFAYGSNMGRRRLCVEHRAPSATFLAIGHLKQRRLTFNKVSSDGSGKCDCEWTGVKEDCVWGVVYRVAVENLTSLDRAEGVGRGYAAATVEVNTRDAVLQARTYVATVKNASLAPYTWYKHHVLVGAEEGRLPEEYIERIWLVHATEDPDRVRHAREMASYG